MGRPKPERPPVVVLFGPTGVGKSETVASLLDSRFECINADSMQVYRRMDIGTAKPPMDVLTRIPHHLISIKDPNEQFNVGEFVKKAEALITEIRSRGRFSVVSGGTAFYIRSLLFGLPESPPSSADVRARLWQREREEGRAAMFGELERRDPVAAGKIQPNDRYRILRALEILEASGRSVFSFRWPRSLRGDYRFLILGLERPRDELYRRIEERIDSMFEQGLVSEVRALIAAGYGAGDPGMRGIGYREFFEMQSGCATLADVKDSIKESSRRYAKRQLTLFRSVPGALWLSPDKPDEIRALIEGFLDERAGPLDLGTGNSA